MKKLPIGSTIAEAYAFTFGHIGKVIALIWLPAVLLTVGRFFVISATPLETPDATMQGPVMVGIFLFDFVALILNAMMAVAIVREVLNPVSRPVFLRFALGPSELRVAGGYVGLFILSMVFVLGFTLVTVFVAIAAKSAGTGIAGAIGFAMIVIGILALIYVLVRLSFLLVPSAVMKGGFGLESSWTLTAGNFWRIFVIGIATLLPIMLVAIAANLVLLGPDLLNLHLVYTKDQDVMNHQVQAVMRIVVKHQPMLLGLDFLLAPFSYAMTYATAAFAYRALTAPSAAEGVA